MGLLFPWDLAQCLGHKYNEHCVCIVCMLYEGAIPCLRLNGAEEGKLQPGLYMHVSRCGGCF